MSHCAEQVTVTSVQGSVGDVLVAEGLIAHEQWLAADPIRHRRRCLHASVRLEHRGSGLP